MAGRLVLTARQREEMRQALVECRDVRFYRRLLALLEIDQGRPVAEVASSLLVTRRSVHSWVQTYRRTGSFEALADQPRPGRPSRWNDELRELLQEWLERSPQEYGYPATVWTVSLLQEQVRKACGQAMADKTLRRELHALGYSWKRARYLLEPDPEAGEKAAPHSGSRGASGASERGTGRR